MDGVESGDVIQGALGDCYFLGAISGSHSFMLTSNAFKLLLHAVIYCYHCLWVLIQSMDFIRSSFSRMENGQYPSFLYNNK